MKTMTCEQLGGACNLEFHAETFEEMAELSRQHGIQMHRANDPAHLAAMRKMQALMKDPNEMQQWYAAKQRDRKIKCERRKRVLVCLLLANAFCASVASQKEQNRPWKLQPKPHGLNDCWPGSGCFQAFGFPVSGSRSGTPLHGLFDFVQLGFLDVGFDRPPG